MRRPISVLLLSLLTMAVSCGSHPGEAESTLRVGVTTMENEGDRAVRWESLRLYLERRLRRKVEIRDASDYASVVEALKSRRLDLAYLGAAAYARAWWVTGGKVRPIAGTLNEDGIPGYQSVIEVRANSSYRSIDDLRGKVLAFADPNSTSGFVAPTYFLREQGKDPASFFRKTIFAGGHEGAVLSLLGGVCDAAATWSYGATRTNASRMAGKGMIPAGSTRIVWTSPMIPTTAWTVLADTPAKLQQTLKSALIEFAKADPAGFAVVGKGRETGYTDIDPKVYEPVIRMVEVKRI